MQSSAKLQGEAIVIQERLKIIAINFGADWLNYRVMLCSKSGPIILWLIKALNPFFSSRRGDQGRLKAKLNVPTLRVVRVYIYISFSEIQGQD